MQHPIDAGRQREDQAISGATGQSRTLAGYGPYEITSRYERGVDTLNGKEIFPAHTDRGVKTSGASQFTLKLEPKNFGVLLRRKLDYAFANPRAEVYVADATAS